MGMIKDQDHRLAHKSGLILEHRKALYDKIGPGASACHKCDRRIYWTSGRGVGRDAISVEFLDGDKTNLDPANLAPLCGSCLRRATNANVIGDDEIVFVNKHGRRERGTGRQCQECGKPFTISLANERTNPKVGKFCSGTCRSIFGNRKRWDNWRANKAK